MKDQYLSYIDGLRALAVTYVVLFHAFPLVFPGGFLGVDIFFVISGFLIGRQMMSRLPTLRSSSGLWPSRQSPARRQLPSARGQL